MQIIWIKKEKAEISYSITKFSGSKKFINEQFIQPNKWFKIRMQTKKMGKRRKRKRISWTFGWVNSIQKITLSDWTTKSGSQKTPVKIKLCSQF